MITRPFPRRLCVLVLSGALLTGGCVSISVTGGSPVVVKSYDLPDTLDVHEVIHAVELAFTQIIGRTPWIVEGSVLSPLPARPAPFTVAERRVHFERLGVATIHEVGCPGSLASVHAWVPDRSESLSPHRYAGCIQLYAGAYRVHLIESSLVLQRSYGLTESVESWPKSHPNLLSRLAQAFLEQVTEAREVTNAHAPKLFPSGQQTREKATIGSSASARERVPFPPTVSEKSVSSSSLLERSQGIATASPLVCLAPKYDAAAVMTQHGAGRVVQVLEQGSLMVVAESIDAAYFRVKTREGLAGWIDRADVRRLPCPIG